MKKSRVHWKMIISFLHFYSFDFCLICGQVLNIAWIHMGSLFLIFCLIFKEIEFSNWKFRFIQHNEYMQEMATLTYYRGPMDIFSFVSSLILSSTVCNRRANWFSMRSLCGWKILATVNTWSLLAIWRNNGLIISGLDMVQIKHCDLDFWLLDSSQSVIP